MFFRHRQKIPEGKVAFVIVRHVKARRVSLGSGDPPGDPPRGGSSRAGGSLGVSPGDQVPRAGDSDRRAAEPCYPGGLEGALKNCVFLFYVSACVCMSPWVP